MDTLAAIEARRAVKHYDSNHVLPEDDRRRLLSAAMLSPTSFNIQNWRFVDVRDPELRQEVREAAWGQAQVTEASMLVILCADLRSWANDANRYWRDAPDTVRESMIPMIREFYEGREQVQRDEAMRSAGIAAQTLMLAAKAMECDSCPMIGFDTAKVAELINLPPDHVVCMIVVIGKAVKPAWPRPGQLLFDDVVITDRFASV